MRRILALVAIVGLICGIGAAAYFSPLFSVRNIEVRTGDSVPSETVHPLVGVAEGTPLLQVDTYAVASRIAELPKAAEVRVTRALPSTLRIEVVERVPAVFYDEPSGAHLMDPSGVTYAIEPPPPGIPRLVVESPGERDEATIAALKVMEVLAPSLRSQLAEVHAPSSVDVRLVLEDGRTVLWGDGAEAQRKARIAEALLTQPGEVFDVSSPRLPTIR
ncbi:cell division protein FtsQ/DivIB [Hoyosella rhizosphaerae]|uniref:POTRA domain-containing protein n=1 Tax=Hoyosella rhizosphaerae TaxID=1755582 RepID=A0A916XHJ8_9ACTN|nr:FtsQ-type POTRA domain-containing protein [Hoyosella rhizosphaerae]GGC70945.1 hypothetical protein GCM10011410_24780 [Hoyosella rhizosphaerae]